MRSIATVCLAGNLPDKLAAAATAGFDAIELFETDLLGHDGSPAEVRRMAEDHGLAIALYQPFRDVEGNPEPQRARTLDRARRKFDTMGELGCDLVLVCSNVQPQALPEPERAADDLHALAELAAHDGIRVGFEALAWGRHVNRWRQAWDIVARADHPSLGLILDSFHTLAVDDTLDGLERVPADKLFFVQIADAPRLALDVLNLSRHHRCFPGQGELPVADFAARVRAHGYQGPLSLEVFNDEFRAGPPRRIARDALASLVFLDDQAGLARLPPPPRLHGIAFAEFAVDAEAEAALGERLRGLGFASIGRHRSKAVTLWRAGGVDFVLNADPEGTASGHFALHGTSVCALALRVDDATACLDRAQAIGASLWRERTGPGELALPGIRAPDGSLVLLVEGEPDARPYEADFEIDPQIQAGSPDAPLGIDHVAIALAPGQLDGAVLFWRSLFGLETQAVVELADPFGLVRSRALLGGEGTSVRLALNTSESRQTATGRFVSAAEGAGVHHLALATANAAASVAGCRARGTAFLPVPPQYHDDLAARFGITEATEQALRTHALLYDEGGPDGSAFLHAYTTSFEERFFFEICERRGGYAGFGAANAAVRLAAQARARR